MSYLKDAFILKNNSNWTISEIRIQGGTKLHLQQGKS